MVPGAQGVSWKAHLKETKSIVLMFVTENKDCKAAQEILAKHILIENAVLIEFTF